MKKCLVTKLNGSSNNSELLRIGEMRMKILKVQNPTDHTQGFSIGFNKSVTLEILSDGYFTDKTLTENKGKRITLDAGTNSIWVNGNNDVEIAILDKYSLTEIRSYYQGETSGEYGKNIKFDISDLQYSTALIGLELYDAQISGNIGELKTLTALESLVLANAQISGNIGELKTLTALKSLVLANAQIPLSGDIGALSTLSDCNNMSFQYSKLTGDIATVPTSCKFISFSNDKGSVFTWSTRPSSANIFAIQGNAKIVNIDKMLQDLAQCQTGIDTSSPSWYKEISCVGSRTSESDAAVQALQQKGYTISITPA